MGGLPPSPRITAMSPTRGASRTAQFAQPTSTFSSRMDSLNVPSSQRPRPAPRHSSSSSQPSGALRLPSLPRFHPANFPSQHTSNANTPSTNPNSPQPPISPRAAQKQYSDTQKQLYFYQRELMNGGSSRTTAPYGNKPVSPRLIPAGSPGPVTPLELEGQSGGYLLAGASANPTGASELVEKLIQQENRRLGTPSPPRPSSAVGGR